MGPLLGDFKPSQQVAICRFVITLLYQYFECRSALKVLTNLECQIKKFAVIFLKNLKSLFTLDVSRRAPRSLNLDQLGSAPRLVDVSDWSTRRARRLVNLRRALSPLWVLLSGRYSAQGFPTRCQVVSNCSQIAVYFLPKEGSVRLRQRFWLLRHDAS